MSVGKNRSAYNYSGVNQDANNAEDTGPTFGMRHKQILILWALSFMAFNFRVILSVGIVAMTDPTVSSNHDIPTYPEWTKKNVILSAFFWGYIWPQIIAAHMAKHHGAKWFLIGAMMIQSLLSFLTPLTAALFGEQGMMINRACQGLCQGFIYPSITHLLSQWVPPQERSRLGSFVFAAGKLGSVFSILVTGFIAASKYGWPMAFYVFGMMGMMWCILMATCGSDKPSESSRISPQERKFIEDNTGISDNTLEHKTPWLKIVTSPAVAALLMAQTGSNFCFWMLISQIPTYMNDVMHFQMKTNSLLSSLPYLTLWLLGFVFSTISDYIINKGYVSRRTARKIFNSIGLLIPAVALIILSFTEGHENWAVVLLVVAVGFNAAIYSGYVINFMDIAPNHCASIMGLCNGLSSTTGFIAPLTVQLFVHHNNNALEWRKVFLLAAAMNCVTAGVYCLFGRAEPQEWDTDEPKENSKDNKYKN